MTFVELVDLFCIALALHGGDEQAAYNDVQEVTTAAEKENKSPVTIVEAYMIAQRTVEDGSYV